MRTQPELDRALECAARSCDTARMDAGSLQRLNLSRDQYGLVRSAIRNLDSAQGKLYDAWQSPVRSQRRERQLSMEVL